MTATTRTTRTARFALAGMLLLLPFGCSSKLRVGVQILNASYLDSPDVAAHQMRQKELEVKRDLAAGRLEARGEELIARAGDTVRGPNVQEEVARFVNAIGLDAASVPVVRESVTQGVAAKVRERITASLALARNSYESGLADMAEVRRLEATLADRSISLTSDQVFETRAKIVDLYKSAHGGFAGGDDELARIRNSSSGLISEAVTASLRAQMEQLAAARVTAANSLIPLLTARRDAIALQYQQAETVLGAIQAEVHRLTAAGGQELALATNQRDAVQKQVDELGAQLIKDSQFLLDAPQQQQLELDRADKLRRAAAALTIAPMTTATPPAAAPTSTPAVADAQTAEIKSAATAVGAEVGGSVARTAQRLGLTAGLTILDDPLASLIVYAPEEYWKGIYNEAFGRTVMGNSDIAIIMNGPGEFTIKGVRMDGSKVAEATFSVLKQTMQIAAAAAGVPVPSFPAAGAGASGQAQAGEDLNSNASITAIRDAAKNTAEAQTKRLLIQQQRLMLLSAVVSQGKVLENAGSSTEAVGSSYQTVKRVLDSAKSTLPAPATPAPKKDE